MEGKLILAENTVNKALRQVRRIKISRVFLISLGAMLSMLLAMLLDLSYSASAGIITILSIQNTKKETLKVALKRLLSFVTAVVTAFFVFKAAGYNTIAFGIYLIIFVSICFYFEWQEGIAMNSVLITHFLAEKSMSSEWIINESLLFAIGVIVGVLLNMTLRSDISKINEYKTEIEEDIKKILFRMSEAIRSKDKAYSNGACFKPLEAKLLTAKISADKNKDNSFSKNMYYYTEYVDMRKNQLEVLKNIYTNICLLTDVPKQAGAIADFISHISESFHEFNNAEGLLTELNEIKQNMKNEELPRHREEFENRAVLLLILYQFEQFLIIKRDFTRNVKGYMSR